MMGRTASLSGSTLSVLGSWCPQKASGIALSAPKGTGNRRAGTDCRLIILLYLPIEKIYITSEELKLFIVKSVSIFPNRQKSPNHSYLSTFNKELMLFSLCHLYEDPSG